MAELPRQFEDLMATTPEARAKVEARRAEMARADRVREAVEYRTYGLVCGKNTPQELAYAKWNKLAQPVLVCHKDGQIVAASIGNAVIAIMNGANLL